VQGTGPSRGPGATLLSRSSLEPRRSGAGRGPDRRGKGTVVALSHRAAPGPKKSSRPAGGGQVAGAGSWRGAGTCTTGPVAGAGSRVSGEGLGRATWTKVA